MYMKNIRRDEVDHLPEDRVYCLRCFWWCLFLHNPVGYRITPPVATLNIHPIANAMSEWDANEGKERREMIAISYKDLRCKTLRCAEVFRKLRASLDENCRDHLDEAAFESKLKNVKDGKFTLMVVGEAKSGKSTFINSYLDTDVLPMDVEQCTSAIIEISYSEKMRLTLYRADSSRAEVVESADEIKKALKETAALDDRFRKIPVSHLNQVIIKHKGKTPPNIMELCESLKEDNLTNLDWNDYCGAIEEYIRVTAPKWGKIVTRIVIEYPFSEAMKDVRIVDSPGVNALGQVGEITEDYIARANAVVFLKSLSGQALESKSFKKFFNTKNGNRHQKSLFLLLSHATEYDNDQVKRLCAKACDMYGKHIKSDMIIPIDSKVQFYLNRTSGLTEKSIGELFKSEAKAKVGGAAGAWVRDRWSYRDDVDSFMQELRDKANFEQVQQKFEEYARTAQWLALKDVLDVLTKGYAQIVAKLKKEIRIKKDQISCSPEELQEKIDLQKKALQSLNTQVKQVIWQISNEFTGPGGVIEKKKDVVVNAAKATLTTTDFDELEKNICEITDPLHAMSIQLCNELIARCDNALEVKLGEKGSVSWGDILTPHIDAEEISRLKDQKRKDPSFVDTVTEGRTFKETKRRFNNQKFVSAVRDSILDRIDGIGKSIQLEVMEKVGTVVEKYKEGLDKRIEDESKILDDKVNEKKGTELLLAEISEYEGVLRNIESVEGDLSEMMVEVKNGGNLE